MTKLTLATFAAGALALGLASGARAQDAVNAFGAYPTQTGVGLPYTTYAPATNYGTQARYLANSRYGYAPSVATMVAPGLTTYNSGYAGTYALSTGRGSYAPAPWYASGATYGYPGYGYPGYGYSVYRYPGYGYTSNAYSPYMYPTYTYRRGLFGLRAR